jgi:hypothetical protein
LPIGRLFQWDAPRLSLNNRHGLATGNCQGAGIDSGEGVLHHPILFTRS